MLPPRSTIRVLWLAPLIVAGCADDTFDPTPLPSEAFSGGKTTIFDDSREAFSYPAKNLTSEQRDTFFLGNTLFNRNWVEAPASVESSDGLGPLYNATSCSACHFKDGRGAPPESVDEPFLGLLLRLSIPGQSEHGAPLNEPTYGGQFNHFSTTQVPAEGKARVLYQEIPGQYADGEVFALRKPTYEFFDLNYGPMSETALVSPRVAPQMIGLGLLEAVSDETLLDLADEDDANGDGISGRPNNVWDPDQETTVIGRLGWKANQPDMEGQVSGAFLGDIGITTSSKPSQDCTLTEVECQTAHTGGEPELSDERLARVVFYSRTLAVPGRRDLDNPAVEHGETLFVNAGCAACHIPSLTTAAFQIEELSGQTIYPYTDLLLHDMGPDLADGRSDFAADGNEWRTPPLWGLGLVPTVNGHSTLLHDGRARNFAEAILWHGGEGQVARDAFASMSASDRNALVSFLESL